MKMFSWKDTTNQNPATDTKTKTNFDVWHKYALNELWIL